MNRRAFLRLIGIGIPAVGVAGCVTEFEGDDLSGTQMAKTFVPGPKQTDKVMRAFIGRYGNYIPKIDAENFRKRYAATLFNNSFV